MALAVFAQHLTPRFPCLRVKYINTLYPNVIIHILWEKCVCNNSFLYMEMLHRRPNSHVHKHAHTAPSTRAQTQTRIPTHTHTRTCTRARTRTRCFLSVDYFCVFIMYLITKMHTDYGNRFCSLEIKAQMREVRMSVVPCDKLS